MHSNYSRMISTSDFFQTPLVVSGGERSAFTAPGSCHPEKSLWRFSNTVLTLLHS